MLTASLSLRTKFNTLSLEAEIANVSNLEATSDYEFAFDDRTALGALKRYPRWSESVFGLVARCIALTEPSKEAPCRDWVEARVHILITPNGRGQPRPLAMARIGHNEDGSLNAGWEEAGLTGFLEAVPARGAYEDAWSVAEHALRLAAFSADALPAAVPLNIELRKDGRLSYICTSDIPQPTRTVFESRMRNSTRPLIQGARDAVYSWDWTGFLNGER